jgi:hypothetical protein
MSCGQGVVAADEAFDAAPFGYSLDQADGKAYGFYWAEPRKIRKLVVEFDSGDALPAVDKVRVQYWRHHWGGTPDRKLPHNPAGYGWVRVDDWTNGKWRNADSNVKVEGQRLTFTFKPTSANEFKRLDHPGVGYRKTLKVRIVSADAMPKPKYIQALTDAICRPVTVRILWGKPADDRIKLAEGPVGRSLEVYNGKVFDIRPLDGGNIRIDSRTNWTQSRGDAGGIEADILMAKDLAEPDYDRTIVTVRSKDRPFSFAPADLAGGERILVDDLGFLVTNRHDSITLEGYRQARKEHVQKTVYDMVFDAGEQTLMRAWNDMPVKRPFYFVHGLPVNRNAMFQYPNGDIDINALRHWFVRPKSPKDTDRKKWPGRRLSLGFGFPADHLRGGRELKEGYLPLMRTWWQDGTVYYEQLTVLDEIDGDWSDIRIDNPSVLMMSVRVVNTSGTVSASARLHLTSRCDKPEKLYIKNDCVYTASYPQPNLLRCLVNTSNRGEFTEQGDGLLWTLPLGPGESHKLLFAIPSITLDKDEEIASLRKRDFESAGERVCGYWRRRTAEGAQITTPEPWLNDFYKAHFRHLLVNCWKEVDTDRMHAHVGTFSYGVFPDESAMMISDLERRGYTREAEQCLESFLHYQGTVMMSGNFKTKKGLFYGSGGHEMGNYNKSHGWVMWNMADHWWTTRDREWMKRAAPKLIESCEWVIRERKSTMREFPAGQRAIEYGWLPAGSLEDVTDYWYWMVTNACTVWGFGALADALSDFGHPEAVRLQAEADAFRKDFLTSMKEARIRCPVVRLRDGTYVPKYPSRLYERGRCYGWLRETLEGAIHLPIMNLIDAKAIESEWILKDFEDNLYISDSYGYDIPVFGMFWFSRGGFSMQANLLHGPLPYLYRDEIKHYLRTYFNSFVSAFYPETRMCNEHCKPELGYPLGDHFKSSDEAQSTYWLRLMFVHEREGNLYLGQAVPRYWLANGKTIGIERAATYFGQLSLQIDSRVSQGEIEAVVTPPERNRPKNIYVRLRHPKAKPIQGVTLNGKPYDQYDKDREWVVLPGSVKGVQKIVARY